MAWLMEIPGCQCIRRTPADLEAGAPCLQLALRSPMHPLMHSPSTASLDGYQRPSKNPAVSEPLVHGGLRLAWQDEHITVDDLSAGMVVVVSDGSGLAGCCFPLSARADHRIDGGLRVDVAIERLVAAMRQRGCQRSLRAGLVGSSRTGAPRIDSLAQRARVVLGGQRIPVVAERIDGPPVARVAVDGFGMVTITNMPTHEHVRSGTGPDLLHLNAHHGSRTW